MKDSKRKPLQMDVWEGQPPQHSLSIKLDGVQVLLHNGVVVSRKLKPLYNVDPQHLEEGKRYEAFLGTFKETRSVLRTLDHERKVRKDELYEIWPDTDPRLLLPLDTDILAKFDEIIEAGGEGLIIDRLYKLKNEITFDVPITDILTGTGKNSDRMGSLVTPMGKVGIGFKDHERHLSLWTVGEIIEVKCMELTPAGKFRMPRFHRKRFDK